MRGKQILGYTAAVLGVLGAIACGGAEPGGVIPAPEDQPSSADPSAVSQPKTSALMSGTLEVGKEVKPGTYSTTAAEDSFGCYWARLRNFDGGVESIIANGNLGPGQKGRFTVKKSDKGLELTGDCVWKKS